MTARKVMLLGEVGVGKTSLVNRFVHGRFRTDYMPTINVEIYTHRLPESDSHPELTLLIWDTDGSFGETIFDSVYLKNAAAAVIVADITRPASLSAMSALADGWRNARPGRPVNLILNKTDLLVSGTAAALPAGLTTPPEASIHRTSAKDGTGVKDAFLATADAIIRRGL